MPFPVARLDILMPFSAATELFTRAFPDPNDPGACLMIARHGDLQHLDYRGLANLETREPIMGSTNFRLASVTKQFTASAILQLRGDGKISLADPAKKHLPELPAYADAIQVRHLLQHTSGLLDYEDFVPQDAVEAVLDADVLRIATEQSRLYFPPGTQFRYSNSGYALLANIIERLTGTNFSAALEQLIFKPLDMNRTVVMHRRHRPHVENRALGYWRQEDGIIVEADQNLTSAVLGDGGIYCSAEDYLKWDKALWEGTLLSKEVISEMMTPGRITREPAPTPTEDVWFPKDMNEPAVEGPGMECKLAGGTEPAGDHECQIPYGLGWRLETNAAGQFVTYHPGSTTGFNNCVRRVPESGWTVLVLANRTSAGSKELARAIEETLPA